MGETKDEAQNRNKGGKKGPRINFHIHGALASQREEWTSIKPNYTNDNNGDREQRVVRCIQGAAVARNRSGKAGSVSGRVGGKELQEEEEEEAEGRSGPTGAVSGQFKVTAATLLEKHVPANSPGAH